ncbi:MULTISPECIES: MBL fold metallo-hydrolase [unclassified Paenibacillus]|uniref:MBL fold metallo-hydrolase n=1 Tax=unclassified Paenibacillus TaxID=185978 RepID=UPI00104A0AC6|nr:MULTISPECIES: MBL fold metallo-hydrolase [unclassified Paenibacillus]NIK67971.1 phosphoribosyl 1,2-cyclic phosphate phosphodiesterase [Paenibacillus sp. BK720]TCN01946.1 phosphoribosyl 1,2-cyclic phosphate phosphodiesterase [Paenibacillus sp. BK033]
MIAITFRGTGDAMGVPRVYCDCEVCGEARTGGVNRRYRSLVQLDSPDFGTMMIDCGPDWSKQMEASGLRFVNRILVTHAHFDHIGGVPEWADACRWLGVKGEAYAPAEVIAEILQRFPWLGRNISFIPIDRPCSFGSWEVSAWKVNHGKNGYAYAFRFDQKESGIAWAYCSDSIGLTDEQQKPLHGLDLLVLGTSFYKENFRYETRSVYDVTEALELLPVWGPKKTLFTHLSHDIDLRKKYPLPSHADFALTGMEISVGI